MTACVAIPPTTETTFRQYAIRGGDGIDGLVVRDMARRSLGEHDVRVRIRAVALNYRDLMVARGTAGTPGRTLVPASDGAGEVIEVGTAVTGLQVGDRVISTFFPDWLAGPANGDVAACALGGSMDGVLAEEVVLPATAWVRMPVHLDFAEAATLTCAGVTAWHGLFGLDPIPPGGTVALLGTGGVSIWALQLAKAAGLRAIVTSSDDTKLERARALGAEATVNYRTTPDWGAAILELTGGRGVDRVLDIGGPDTIGQSITALRVGGTIAIIGRLTGTAPARFDPAALFGGAKRLAGLMVGSLAMTRDLARFVEQTRLKPVIDRTFRFEQVGEGYRYLEGAAHFGKVVVHV
ncbi:NAD(P)-dependent alcohol dehydrogenase [Lysobacter rhizosphaerae]